MTGVWDDRNSPVLRAPDGVIGKDNHKLCRPTPYGIILTSLQLEFAMNRLPHIAVFFAAVLLLCYCAAAQDKAPSKELLKDYRGKVQLPEDLYKTYEELVQVMTGKQVRIKEFCLPHAITITTALRPEKSREYGPMNLPFLKNGFHKYILNLRKDSDDTYLIRTGSSYMWFVKTKSEGWKLYRYGDKPIQ